MARKRRFPPYPRRAHSSGQARVKVDGRAIYLGAFGTPESWVAYRRLLAQWETGIQPSIAAPSLTTVADVCLAYDKRIADRVSVKQLDRVRKARAALKAFLPLVATDFGQGQLEAVQMELVKRDLSRQYINALVGCVRRMFKFAASRKLAPISVWQELSLVPDLKPKELGVREGVRVRPADPKHVEATIKALRPPLAAVVQVMRFSGCRTGEALSIRPADVDRSGQVWVYRPRSHKTERHGKERIVHLGPKAQAALAPFLLRDPESFCFSPREAFVKRGRWKARPHYDTMTAARAVMRACRRAGVPRWHLNQLRHLFATELRAAFGIEAARLALGHSRLTTTEIYADANHAAIIEAARKIG